VAIGSLCGRLASSLGRVGDDEVANPRRGTEQLGLSFELPGGFDTDELIDAMGHDKKAHHDLSFVLAGSSGFRSFRTWTSRPFVKVLERFKGAL